MPEWINQTHAGFVLAAYAVAAVALIGIGVASWRAHACRAKEWAALSGDKNSDDE